MTSRQGKICARTNSSLAKLLTRCPTLGRWWGRFASIAANADVPWVPMKAPLRTSRVCLITTGGLHLKTDPPFNMDDPEGDPNYRAIPATATRADLTITHNYYDHTEADLDFNIVFPIDRLRELASAGHLGGLTSTHYSFMGHIAGRYVDTLERAIVPELIGRMRSEAPDFVFLTPA